MSDKATFNDLPPEVLYHIFYSLPGKMIMRCRAVCVRWKQIIERMTRAEFFWEKCCIAEFENVYKIARKNCQPGMSWLDLYQTLSLWSKLCDAEEEQDEFCSAASFHEEIRNLTVLSNGIIGVHKENAIIYYNIDTLRLIDRLPIRGSFLRYSENDEYIVLMSYQLIMYIIEKVEGGKIKANSFHDVKSFVLMDQGVYHIDLNDNICFTTFDHHKLVTKTLSCSSEGVMAAGCTDNDFHILTFERNIFTLVGNKLVLVATLGPETNLMHTLNQYNLLGMLDWRIFFQWLFLLNQDVPSGPLQDTIVTRIYGDIVFVGSNWGVLRIYYKPYKFGQLDLFHSKPIKQYNFMERSDCPVLATCPILNVDVYEVQCGHIVIVVMPKKVALLKYKHTTKKASDTEHLDETELFKFLSIDDVYPRSSNETLIDKGSP